MAEGLILLIVGAAAAVGGPALAIWLWVRRGRPAAPTLDHNDSGEATDALLDVPVDSAGATAALFQPGAHRLSDGASTQHDEKSILDGNSDLARSAPGSVSALEAVVPDVLADMVAETDTDSGREHDAENPATVANAERASVAEDQGEAAPPCAAAALAVQPADVTAVELSADPGAALADALAPPAAGSHDGLPREAESEAPAAHSTEEAPQKEPAHQDQPLETEAFSGLAREACDTAEAAETDGAGYAAAESELDADAFAVQADPPDDDLGLSPQQEREPPPEPPLSDPLPDSIFEETAGEAASADRSVRTRQRRSNPAQHRDRRGQRRALAPQAAPGAKRAEAAEAALRTPAEAKLRLMLHPIRRTASLSAVLARPPGYPDRVTLLLGEGAEVGAYSEDRYDDVDIDWTADLLSAELRLDCEEGYQWLRSGRRIHIFGEVADEPGMMSVGSAGLLSPSTIVCRSEDAAAVHAAAQSCGSPTLVSLDHWSGIPGGWMVLSGYRPAHAAASGLAAGLTVLDPGVGSEIRLSEGLRIRSASFAEGCPPRIEIAPFPSGATVTIDGRPAELGEDGAWTADGWERPGDHLIDVVPGPSAAYRIIEDPWTRDGWEAWDAHPERFGASAHAPWAVAQVCGGAVSGPGGEYVVAANAMLSVVCLGLRRGVVVLRGRPDAPVAVGLLGVPPAFLISASGRRRKQGRIAWLSPFPAASGTRTIDPQWVAEVRSASARRLPLDGGGALAEDAWRKARERARRHKRPRS